MTRPRGKRANTCRGGLRTCRRYGNEARASEVVEVPQVQYVEKVVEVSLVKVEEVYKPVPPAADRIVAELRVGYQETIGEVRLPWVEEVERVVEGPQVHRRGKAGARHSVEEITFETLFVAVTEAVPEVVEPVAGVLLVGFRRPPTRPPTRRGWLVLAVASGSGVGSGATAPRRGERTCGGRGPVLLSASARHEYVSAFSVVLPSDASGLSSGV